MTAERKVPDERAGPDTASVSDAEDDLLSSGILPPR
jgi:hypothetical protein